MNTVTVIVVKCMPKGDCYGERIVDQRFEGERALNDAQKLANEHLNVGLCVIVRPNYTETDDNGGRFFREWRSFNSSLLREVRFDAAC